VVAGLRSPVGDPVSQSPLDLPGFEEPRRTFEMAMQDFLVRRIINGRKTETRRTNRRWLKARPGDWIYLRGTTVVCEVTAYPYLERLASIPWASALAEGVVERDDRFYATPSDLRAGYHKSHVSPIAAFFDLWRRIHPEGSASSVSKNPEVVVIPFRYLPPRENKS
jgi:hypothetical protein